MAPYHPRQASTCLGAHPQDARIVALLGEVTLPQMADHFPASLLWAKQGKQERVGEEILSVWRARLYLRSDDVDAADEYQPDTSRSGRVPRPFLLMVLHS